MNLENLINKQVEIQTDKLNLSKGKIIDVYFDSTKGMIYQIELDSKDIVNISPNQVKAWLDYPKF